MHVARVAVSACVVWVGLTGCESTHRVVIELPRNAPVELMVWQQSPGTTVLQKKTVLLQPDAPEYRRLAEWITSNQNGWRKLPLDKGPPDGIIVSFGDFRLHFHLRGVTLSTKSETFYKEIREDDYAFLKPPVGI